MLAVKDVVTTVTAAYFGFVGDMLVKFSCDLADPGQVEFTLIGLSGHDQVTAVECQFFVNGFCGFHMFVKLISFEIDSISPDDQSLPVLQL